MRCELPDGEHIECSFRCGFHVLDDGATPGPEQVPEIDGVLVVISAEMGQVLVPSDVVADKIFERAVGLVFDTCW